MVKELDRSGAERRLNVIDSLTLNPDLDERGPLLGHHRETSGKPIEIRLRSGFRVVQIGNVLPAGMAFPLAFGLGPGTGGGDGDPLDFLVLSDDPLAIRVLATVQLLGAIEADQAQDRGRFRNDRMVAKIAESHAWAGIADLHQFAVLAQANDVTGGVTALVRGF